MYRRTFLPKKKKKTFLKLALILLIVFSTTSYLYISKLKSPVDEKDDTPITFDIKLGESVKDISKKLKEQELIKNTLYFEYFTKKENLSSKIRAGRFTLRKNQDLKSILERIVSPPELTIVTIQEGLRIKDIDKRLAEHQLISEGDFIKEIENFKDYEYYPYLKTGQNLEGFLFPDTYHFDPSNFNISQVIFRAMDNFEIKLNQVVPESEPLTIFEAIEKSPRTISEIIIMASIIEKEVITKKDKRLVSGILWKRLDNNWLIGADATLLYKKDDKIITRSDLDQDDPYNTRKLKGLPPTAIANPSLDSIIASVFPTQSEYWFYLNAKGTGETIFAKTNDEHNANKNKYL